MKLRSEVWRGTLPVVICLALALAGCIQSDNKVVLHADGSVDAKYQAAISDKALKELMGDLFKGEEFKPEPLYNEKDIRNAFARIKDDGVTLKSLKVGIKDGWQRISLEVRCRDLLAVGVAAKAAEMDIRYSLLKNANGSYTLKEEQTQLFDPTAMLKSLGLKATEEDRKKAREKVKGLRMVTTFVLPSKVVSSNATHREGRMVKWVLDGSDEKFLGKAQAMVEKDISATFDGKGLKLAEVGRHRYILGHTGVVLNADGSVVVTKETRMHRQLLREARGFARPAVPA